MRFRTYLTIRLEATPTKLGIAWSFFATFLTIHVDSSFQNLTFDVRSRRSGKAADGTHKRSLWAAPLDGMVSEIRPIRFWNHRGRRGSLPSMHCHSRPWHQTSLMMSLVSQARPIAPIEDHQCG